MIKIDWHKIFTDYTILGFRGFILHKNDKRLKRITWQRKHLRNGWMYKSDFILHRVASSEKIHPLGHEQHK